MIERAPRPIGPVFLSTYDAARLLGVERRTVIRRAMAGHLPARKVGRRWQVEVTAMRLSPAQLQWLHSGEFVFRGRTPPSAQAQAMEADRVLGRVLGRMLRDPDVHARSEGMFLILFGEVALTEVERRLVRRALGVEVGRNIA